MPSDFNERLNYYRELQAERMRLIQREIGQAYAGDHTLPRSGHILPVLSTREGGVVTSSAVAAYAHERVEGWLRRLYCQEVHPVGGDGYATRWFTYPGTLGALGLRGRDALRVYVQWVIRDVGPNAIDSIVYIRIQSSYYIADDARILAEFARGSNNHIGRYPFDASITTGTSYGPYTEEEARRVLVWLSGIHAPGARIPQNTNTSRVWDPEAFDGADPPTYPDAQSPFLFVPHSLIPTSVATSWAEIEAARSWPASTLAERQANRRTRRRRQPRAPTPSSGRSCRPKYPVDHRFPEDPDGFCL